MTRKELDLILKSQIPISRAMGLRVTRCEMKKGVAFKLPLKPNRNHKQTVFGGTLVAAQALACWSWLMVLLNEHGVHAEVVIQRQKAEFLRPVKKDFNVQTEAVKRSDQIQFIKTLKRHSKARLTITANVNYNGILAATFTGEYVAIISL